MKLADVKPGDILIADSGFTCIDEGARLEVAEDSKHANSDWPGCGLYVLCDAGRHFLDGQEGADGELIGLAKARA